VWCIEHIWLDLKETPLHRLWLWRHWNVCWGILWGKRGSAINWEWWHSLNNKLSNSYWGLAVTKIPPERALTPHLWFNFLYRVKVYSNEYSLSHARWHQVSEAPWHMCWLECIKRTQYFCFHFSWLIKLSDWGHPLFTMCTEMLLTAWGDPNEPTVHCRLL